MLLLLATWHQGLVHKFVAVEIFSHIGHGAFSILKKQQC
uniref:Uncharacterized protein n=1 Tax=Anguilla anguilla TaxID=7936 RepID=A0A0E9VCH6_ANGAN